MADLDYAFLADRAQVENGRLFVLGGSFTHVTLGSLPTKLAMTLAGRIKTPVDEPVVPVSVRITSPDGRFEIELQGAIGSDGSARPYNDKLGLVFALSFEVPITSEGLYSVHLSIQEQEVRRLAFDVETPSQVG